MERKLEFHKLQNGEVMIYNTTVLTKADIIEIISISGAEKEIFEGVQERKLEKLKPTWFEYASKRTKQERQEYKDANNLEMLQWLHDNISYNADWTMNIFKLHKTFCEDLSWTGKEYNRKDAKQLAESKWYTLPTDYNEYDSDKEKQQSDRYRVINLFTNGDRNPMIGIGLFRDMTWCKYRYWTATPYKDEKWKEVSDIILIRTLNHKNRNCDYSRSHKHVCGFKDME